MACHSSGSGALTASCGGGASLQRRKHSAAHPTDDAPKPGALLGRGTTVPAALKFTHGDVTAPMACMATMNQLTQSELGWAAARHGCAQQCTAGGAAAGQVFGGMFRHCVVVTDFIYIIYKQQATPRCTPVRCSPHEGPALHLEREEQDQRPRAAEPASHQPDQRPAAAAGGRGVRRPLPDHQQGHAAGGGGSSSSHCVQATGPGVAGKRRVAGAHVQQGRAAGSLHYQGAPRQGEAYYRDNMGLADAWPEGQARTAASAPQLWGACTEDNRQPAAARCACRRFARSGASPPNAIKTTTSWGCGAASDPRAALELRGGK